MTRGKKNLKIFLGGRDGGLKKGQRNANLEALAYRTLVGPNRDSF